MLFTIGLIFMMIAAVTLIVGPETQSTCRAVCRGQLDLGFMTYRTYSIVCFASSSCSACGCASSAPDGRQQIRAAVDNRRMAESLGIDIVHHHVRQRPWPGGGSRRVSRPRSAIFAQYLVIFLIVRSRGGLGATGVFYASSSSSACSIPP